MSYKYQLISRDRSDDVLVSLKEYDTQQTAAFYGDLKRNSFKDPYKYIVKVVPSPSLK